MFRHLAVAAALWPLLATTLEAQPLDGWHWRSFTSHDGLAESWVRGVTRGPSGRIFISHGAVDALTVFDGYTMSSHPCPGPSLRVIEGPDGEAWASVWDEKQVEVAGIQWFDGRRWNRIAQATGAPHAFEGRIAATGRGRAVFLTPAALLAVDAHVGSTRVLLAAAETGLGQFLALLPARDGGVWVTGTKGAIHLDPESGGRKEFALAFGLVDLVSPQEGRPSDLWGVVSTTPASRKTDTGKAVVRLVGNRFEVIARSQGQPALYAGWPDPDGGHWLLRRTYDRAYLGHVSGGIEREASPGKVLSRIVNDVLVEPDGGFWIAAGLGVAHASPATWREPAGLPVHDGPFPALVRDPTTLYALHESGLLIRRDGRWTRRALPAGAEPDTRVSKGLAVLADGRLAVPIRRPGLILYDPGRDRFEDARLDPPRWVMAMTPARNGGLWLVTTSPANDFRIDRWDGRMFRTAVSTIDLAKLGEVRCLLEVSDGSLWLGGISGSIGRLSGERLETFAPGQGYEGRGAFSFFEAGPGTIWLGERTGIRQFDGKTFSMVRDKLETVRAMVRAPDGAVWVATGGGLHRFKDSSWLDLSTADGLPDAGVQELLEDPQGRLWVGTTNGLRVEHSEADQDPPRTELPGRVETTEVSPRGDVQFAFGGRDRWDVTPIDRLLFSYRLDGAAWSPFQKEAVAVVRALDPGKHRVEVRSMDRSGNVDPRGAALDVRVLLPWYREPAVVGVSVLAVLALALFGGSVAHRYATLDRLVRERTAALDGANRELRQSEQRLRLVIDAIPELVAWKGLDGRYLGANRAFAAAVNRSDPEEVIGLQEHDFLPVTEEAVSLAAACQLVMESDVPQTGCLQTVHLARGAASLEINRVPLHDHDGRVVGVLFTATDVTSRQEAERDRERLEASLHQAQRLEAVGKLAGGIAHDFNNILTVIAGHAALLTRRVATDHAAAKDVRRIGEAVERATALTRQILAFSRGQVMQPRVLDLNAAVVDLVPLLSRLIGEDLELATQLDPALRHITADPAKLEQVILNLAVNARDAMPAGGRLLLETANVEVREADPRHRPGLVPGEYVMLAVTDNGSGMPPEVLDRVFEPFYTTKPTGQGTGLGLATVYGIVKQSGGDVWVYSELGHGTTFKVYLPSTTAAAEEKPVFAESAPSARGGGTVLLAEDEPALQELVVETLTEAGYTVIAASRAAEALERAASHPEPIQLLLTDVIMPGMSGPELARRLQELRPEMRVVFMSGYTANTLGQQGVSEQDVLEKPFSPQALLRKLESVLKARPPDP
jgi:PAS domain S-box-containing protein